MIPYASFFYFGVLVAPTTVAVALGLAERLSWRWVLLATLAMSLVQYWGWTDPGVLPAARTFWLVAAYAGVQWAIARTFLHLRTRGRSRRDFFIAVALSLAPLAAAKLVRLTPLVAAGTATGFLGLSYVSFRALDVIIGIQDGLIPTLPTGHYVAYLFFFPTISAGPIDRYRRFVSDCDRTRTRAEFLHDVAAAVHRLFDGLLYKFVIAVAVQRWWLGPLATRHGAWATLSYMYAYSAFLFFDFAGYSHFAIGISYLFGIRTPENFDRPFLAPTIAEFWNRWHMSLSFWFRDHIYMRFMLAAAKGRWFRNRQIASYAAFVVTFGLMGAWHGLAWRYLAYGMYHALLLSGHQALSRRGRRRPWHQRGPLWRLAAIVVTANLVCLGFLIFSGRLG